MKKWIIISILCLTVCGCATLHTQSTDPNSWLNGLLPVTKAVSDGAAGAGVPWAALSSLGLSALMAGLAAYNRNQKNKITGVTKAVVAAVDSLPDELQGDIKAVVRQNLKDNDIYLIGKAIISGLKEGK